MIPSRLKFPIAQDGVLQLRLRLIEFDPCIKLRLTRILLYWTNGKALFLWELKRNTDSDINKLCFSVWITFISCEVMNSKFYICVADVLFKKKLHKKILAQTKNRGGVVGGASAFQPAPAPSTRAYIHFCKRFFTLLCKIFYPYLTSCFLITTARQINEVQ